MYVLRSVELKSKVSKINITPNVQSYLMNRKGLSGSSVYVLRSVESKSKVSKINITPNVQSYLMNRKGLSGSSVYVLRSVESKSKVSKINITPNVQSYLVNPICMYYNPWRQDQIFLTYLNVQTYLVNREVLCGSPLQVVRLVEGRVVKLYRLPLRTTWVVTDVA